MAIDPIRLFDLRLADFVCLNTYFVNAFLDDERGNPGLMREIGDRLYAALRPLPEVIERFSQVSPATEETASISIRPEAVAVTAREQRGEHLVGDSAGVGVACFPKLGKRPIAEKKLGEPEPIYR